jgi:general stress protein 26
MTRDREKHFFDLLRTFNYAMLVTHSRQGELHARPMALAEAEDQGDLWLVTDVHSEKVEELAEDARVSVSMQAGDRYVALSGKAEVVRDPDRVHALWNEKWRTWFPKGVEDPALVLIRVKPMHGEYWDNEGVAKAKFLYHAARAYLTGHRPSVGKDPDLQGKVELSH